MFAKKDGQSSLLVWDGNFRLKTAFKARDKTVSQTLDFLRRPVRGNDNLPIAREQLVEGMENFFLEAFFADEELDVINQQSIKISEMLAESGERAARERLMDMVAKILARQAFYFAGGASLGDFPGDGVEQMSLAQSRGAMDEQWIVG